MSTKALEAIGNNAHPMVDTATSSTANYSDVDVVIDGVLVCSFRGKTAYEAACYAERYLRRLHCALGKVVGHEG